MRKSVVPFKSQGFPCEMARFHDDERTKGEKVQIQWSRNGEVGKSFK